MSQYSNSKWQYSASYLWWACHAQKAKERTIQTHLLSKGQLCLCFILFIYRVLLYLVMGFKINLSWLLNYLFK